MEWITQETRKQNNKIDQGQDKTIAEVNIPRPRA